MNEKYKVQSTKCERTQSFSPRLIERKRKGKMCQNFVKMSCFVRLPSGQDKIAGIIMRNYTKRVSSILSERTLRTNWLKLSTNWLKLSTNWLWGETLNSVLT